LALWNMNKYSTSNIIYRPKFVKIIMFPRIRLVDCGPFWNNFYVVTLQDIPHISYNNILYSRLLLLVTKSCLPINIQVIIIIIIIIVIIIYQVFQFYLIFCLRQGHSGITIPYVSRTNLSNNGRHNQLTFFNTNQSF
jgi:hypothetical protein